MWRRRTTNALGVFLVLLLTATAAGFNHLRAAAFIVQAAGLGGFAQTAADLATHQVSSEDIAIPSRQGALRGRLFRPDSITGPPVLVVPGVHAGGIDEPRLVQFARDVASVGRIVVAAELPELKAYRITPNSTDAIEDAALWLGTRSGHARDGRVEIMGISFAGGLSIVAAGRPSLRSHVAAVLSFGGHGELARTLTYLCTGLQPDGNRRPPHDYGVAIILLGVADAVVPAGQAAPLRESILAFLNASHLDMVDKERAKVEFARARAMADALAEPAQTLMRYVNERDVAHLGPVLLPHVGAFSADAALSPEKSQAPAAPVYLLHGTDDNVIPAVESSLLAAHLRRQGAAVHQLATPLITHAEVDRSAAARAFLDLVNFWAGLFSEE